MHFDVKLLSPLGFISILRLTHIKKLYTGVQTNKQRNSTLNTIPLPGNTIDLRARWIAAYFKDVYCGRMTSTQRSESTNRIVKRNHIDPTTPLHVFARKMFQVLERRKEAEARETIESQV